MIYHLSNLYLLSVADWGTCWYLCWRGICCCCIGGLVHLLVIDSPSKCWRSRSSYLCCMNICFRLTNQYWANFRQYVSAIILLRAPSQKPEELWVPIYIWMMSPQKQTGVSAVKLTRGYQCNILILILLFRAQELWVPIYNVWCLHKTKQLSSWQEGISAIESSSYNWSNLYSASSSSSHNSIQLLCRFFIFQTNMWHWYAGRLLFYGVYSLCYLGLRSDQSRHIDQLECFWISGNFGQTVPLFRTFLRGEKKQIC